MLILPNPNLISHTRSLASLIFDKHNTTMELYQNTCFLLITCLGFISLAKLLIHLFIWVWITFLRPPKDLKTYGSWALVTGSADGIGKALAMELAVNGLNLVLVDRNSSKLVATREEIMVKGKDSGVAIDIKTVVIDFATCRGEEVGRIIEDETRGLDVGILINNVGLANPYAMFYHEVDLELTEAIIRVNVEATTSVTRGVLSGMLRRGKGAIVNIGSGSSASLSSYPLFTVYAATKAYVAMLSRSISLEYKEQGIDVQCQIPFLVATKMVSIRKSSFFIPSPETYSKASIRWIGHDAICLPYWRHALQAYIMCILPEPVLDWCLFQYFLGMRARGMRKDSRVKHSRE